MPGIKPANATIILDPTGGVAGSPKLVLAFTLPEPVVAGTLIVTEPGGGISDILRFTDKDGD